MTRNVLRGLIVALVTAAALWSLPSPASAHQPGSTLVVVSTGGTAARPTLLLDVQVPISRLDFAYHRGLAADPGSQVRVQRGWLEGLFTENVAVRSVDGAADRTGGATTWDVVVEDLALDRAQGKRTIHAELTATPSADVAADGEAVVELTWQVITDIVYSHKVYVGGRDGTGKVQLVGMLTHQDDTVRLQVDAPASGGVSFISMLTLGFEHFRAGTDHLLFLALLALGVVRRRTGPGSTARRLAALTVTFTVGHSLSLALAALGWVTLPSRAVETAIAATIVLTAVHSARPRLGLRTEVALTAAFGLVHGFGFAGTLEDVRLRGTELIEPLLGFNLGLEAAQLAALALVVAPLWLLSRSRVATLLVAGTIGVIAASWVAQRLFGAPNPLDPVVTMALGSPERLALVLLVVALLTTGVLRLGGQQQPPHRPRATQQAEEGRPGSESGQFIQSESADRPQRVERNLAAAARDF